MDIKQVMKRHAYQNMPLGYDAAYELGMLALRGCAGDPLAQIQSIVALSALHTRATYHAADDAAAEQIAGVCATVFDHDIATSTLGFIEPVGDVMDNCGMGGDLVVTANVSTLAALIAAAGGIRMCKHGSPANADGGRHGSSDFIDLLGIERCPEVGMVERCVDELGFGYSEALDTRYKRIHCQTHEVAQLPHMNDIIGPVTNPVRPTKLKRRVLGINHLIPPRVVAKAFRILNTRGITVVTHGLFVRGFTDDRTSASGMDEVSICQAGTLVAELKDGEITEYWLTAEDFGLKSVASAAISPASGMSKGEFSMRILCGEIQGPPLQMVLANAALLFKLNDPALTYPEAYQRAEQIHRDKLDQNIATEVARLIPSQKGAMCLN